MRYREVGFGAPYMPSPEEVAERAERIRRSWFDPELRAQLGLKVAARLRNAAEPPEEQDGLDDEA